MSLRPYLTGEQPLVAEYDPRTLRDRLAFLKWFTLPALVLAVWVTSTDGVVPGAQVFGLGMVGVAIVGCLIWASHRNALGRRVVFDARQRTITFVRPTGLFLWWSGRDRVVPFENIRAIHRNMHGGIDSRLFVCRNNDGRRGWLSIDSSMTNFHLACEFVEHYLGDRTPKPMKAWKFALLILGLLVGGAVVIAVAVIAMFLAYDGLKELSNRP